MSYQTATMTIRCQKNLIKGKCVCASLKLNFGINMKNKKIPHCRKNSKMKYENRRKGQHRHPNT